MDQAMIAGWAATIGSSLFVVVFTLEGLLRPGYHPRAMHVSALSLGPRGWIQKANFIVLGFLLLLAAWGIGTGFPGGGPSRAGLILLGIVAFLFVVSGVFVMDPAATPQGQATASGIVHGLAGGIIFLLMPITMFVFLRGFGLDPGWGTMPS
jgi:hypothetical protein